MSFYSRINGVGRYLPKNKVTNFDLEQIMDTSDEWIQKRTGIKARYWAADEESTMNLGYDASINGD